MANEENKIQFGLKNVHYAVWNGSTYETPVPIPGAVDINLAAEGEMQKFYADDMAYYTTNANGGYRGDIEIARVPDQMMREVFGFQYDDTDHVIIEDANAEAVPFALLFQFSADKNNELHVLYSCTASRPNITGHTKEENTTPQTQTLSISAVADARGYVRARTDAQTPANVRANWFKAVWMRQAAS